MVITGQFPYNALHSEEVYRPMPLLLNPQVWGMQRHIRNLFWRVNRGNNSPPRPPIFTTQHVYIAFSVRRCFISMEYRLDLCPRRPFFRRLS